MNPNYEQRMKEMVVMITSLFRNYTHPPQADTDQMKAQIIRKYAESLNKDVPVMPMASFIERLEDCAEWVQRNWRHTRWPSLPFLIEGMEHAIVSAAQTSAIAKFTPDWDIKSSQTEVKIVADLIRRKEPIGELWLFSGNLLPKLYQEGIRPSDLYPYWGAFFEHNHSRSDHANELGYDVMVARLYYNEDWDPDDITIETIGRARVAGRERALANRPASQDEADL